MIMNSNITSNIFEGPSPAKIYRLFTAHTTKQYNVLTKIHKNSQTFQFSTQPSKFDTQVLPLRNSNNKILLKK